MDQLFAALIQLVLWPYETWKRSIEDSRLGASEFDHQTLRFWKWFAIIVGGLIFVAWLALSLLPVIFGHS